jgi:hypothetical protein
MGTDPSIEKPVSVRRAAACLWGSAGLALVLTALEVVWPVEPGNPGETIAVGVIIAALLALIAAKTSTGRRWARWLYVFLYTVGTFSFLLVFLVNPSALHAYPTLLLMGTLVQFVLQTTAIVLIFKNASRQWFNAARAKTAP